jgi:hypothetical protein
MDGMNGGGDPFDGIVKPLPSIPFPDLGGSRKLTVDESRLLHSTSVGSTLRSVGLDTQRKAVDAPRSQRLAHWGNVTSSEEATRSLQGVCSITNTVLGFNYVDNSVETGSTWIPPDPHGAVGASRLVGAVNSMMEVRRKDGTLLFRKGFQSFFSGFSEALESSSFFDPKVIYDEHEGRFVIVVLQQSDSPQVSRIWLAVSTGETPDTGSSWNQFYINSIVSIGGVNAWADYPGLEVDEEAVYITNNMFRFSDRNNVGVRYWVFSKGKNNGFYAGQAFSLLIVNPYATQGSAATTMPAQVHGSSGVDGSVGTFMPAVLTFTDGSVTLQIYTLLNPISASPTFTIQSINLGVLTQGLPDAPQLGTSVGINTGDGRTQDAVWRNNKLYVVFTINPRSGVNQGQATAHWVRLGTSGGTVTLEAQGDLGGEGIAAGSFTYYPSVAVNTRGVVAYGYAASSPTTYGGAYVSVGTSEQAYTVKSGLAPYNRVRGGRNRWGDYTGISVDPTDDSFWVFNEYAETVGSAGSDGDGRWGTAWGRLLCTVRFLVAGMLHPLSLFQMFLMFTSLFHFSDSTSTCSSTKLSSQSSTQPTPQSSTQPTPQSSTQPGSCSSSRYPCEALRIVRIGFVLSLYLLWTLWTFVRSLQELNLARSELVQHFACDERYIFCLISNVWLSLILSDTTGYDSEICKYIS